MGLALPRAPNLPSLRKFGISGADRCTESSGGQQKGGLNTMS